MIYSRNNIQKSKAKVTLLLSLFCFLISSNLIAQEAHFGVKAGLNYSSIVGDLVEGLKFRFSGHAGIYLEIEVTDKFSFQPEIVYSSQGFQFSSDLQTIQNEVNTFNQNDIRTNVQFNFLNIPVLAKFSLNERLSLDFGPQVGFLLNQVTKIKNLDQRDEARPDDRTSISGGFQLDYGAVAGVTYKIGHAFSVQPRFYLGLRNRLNGFGGDLQNYNIAIQISVNYQVF